MDPRRKDGTFPFKYTSSVKTDVRETMERERQRLQAPKPAERQKVQTLERKRNG